MGTSSSFDSKTSEQGYFRREVSLPGKWAYLYSEDFRPLTVLCISARGAVARIDETLVPNRELRFRLPLSEEFEFQANATVKNQSGELVDLEFSKRDLTAALRLNAYAAFPQWARNKQPDDKMSVLVIHPDVQAADALEKYLTTKGYEVDVALGVNAGWELAKSFQHELTLVTSRMGLKTAFALCQNLVGEKLTPVLWIQENQEVDSELLILSGACASIRKPFTLEQLHRAIHGLRTFFHSLIVLPPREGTIRSERRATLVEPTGTIPGMGHTEIPRSRPFGKVELPPALPTPPAISSEPPPPTPHPGAVETPLATEAAKPTAPTSEEVKPTVAHASPDFIGASVTTLVAADAEKELPVTEVAGARVTHADVAKPRQTGAAGAEKPAQKASSAPTTAPRVTKPTSYTAVLAKGAAERLTPQKAHGRLAGAAAAGVVVLALVGWYGYSRLYVPKPPTVALAAPTPPASSLEVSRPRPATPLTGLSAIPRGGEESSTVPTPAETPPQTSPAPVKPTKVSQPTQAGATKEDGQPVLTSRESEPADSTPKATVVVESLEKFKLRMPPGNQGSRTPGMPETALPLTGGMPTMPEAVVTAPSLPELVPPVQVEAKAIKRTDPALPLSAKLYHGSYEVVVVATIDPTGKVTEAHALRKDNYGFGQAASQAVKQWIFSPATQNGRPVASTQAIRFVFRGRQN